MTWFLLSYNHCFVLTDLMLMSKTAMLMFWWFGMNIHTFIHQGGNLEMYLVCLLSVCLSSSVCLSVCLSVCQSVSSSTVFSMPSVCHLSVCWFIDCILYALCLSVVCLSVCRFIHCIFYAFCLSFCLSVYPLYFLYLLSVWLSGLSGLSVCLSVCLSVGSSTVFCMPCVYLSVSVSVCEYIKLWMSSRWLFLKRNCNCNHIPVYSK